MNREIKILMIEDVAEDAELELRELEKAGFKYINRCVDNETDLRKILVEFNPDIILSDFALRGSFDGMHALEICQQLCPDTPFIFVSGTIGEERAIESLKRGANDYVLKTNTQRLAEAVRRALDENETRLARKHAEQEIENQWIFFRKVIDLDKNLIFTMDKEGRFVLVNEATARVLGTTVENLIGKTKSDFITDKKLIEQFRQDELEIMQTQQEKFFPEVKIRDSEGKTRWLQTSMRPIISADGEANMVLGVATDITERKKMEDDLRQSIQRFETISRATNDAVWDWDLKTDSLWWNDSFKSLFGYQDDDIEPHISFWINRVHPDDVEHVKQGIYQVINDGGKYWNDEYRFLRRDGFYTYVYDRGFVMRDDAGKGVRMIGAMMDMSDRYDQEMKIARLNRIRAVLSGINYTIVRVNDRETLCNEACRIAVEHGKFIMAWIGLLGQSGEEIYPVAFAGADQGFLNITRFLVDETTPEGKNLVSRALRQNKVIVSDNAAVTEGIRYRRELLERGFLSFAVLPLSSGNKVVGTFTIYSNETDAFDEEEMKLLREMAADISFALDHIEKEQRLSYLAYYDSLTGLPNRDLFNDRLTQSMHLTDKARSIGLILLDVERFGYINDVYGRYAGDALLKKIANYLREIIPDTDHLARVGANCFAILLTGLKDPADVAHFLEEKLVSFISESLDIEGHNLKISFKAGVAIYPNDGEDAEIIFKNAEAALKGAKHCTDRYLFYTKEMNALIAEKLSLEGRLRQALEKDEFVLFYQPKINLIDGQVCGLEALIRWNSKEGLVPPMKFIPLLEETGMIIEVGLWAIKRAMLDSRNLTEMGLEPPRIAVNVSPVQLRQKNFVSEVIQVLKEFPEHKSGLELEITETLIMENLDENIKRLRELRENGINISIDDFGTGYSSLSYMSKLPINTLKIDRAFISAMLSSPDDTSIVSAIISLAHSLKLGVIAEGVETLEQANLLKLLRCDQFQGFLFSPPVPCLDIESMLREKKLFA